jgi:copper chaperone NosL
MKKISHTQKIILAIAALSLMGTFFFPVWEIELSAPQYPEGLSMQIWLDKITGQVDIINGLNHYIGMKHINASMFPEFGYLTYVMIGFILLGLVVALIGKRSFLLGYVLLLIAGGTAAMVDFYNWGYDYGHNLDPTAAIQVPGLTYQPPLIGHKQLLNFDAYSYPAAGGWMIVNAGLVFIAVLLFSFFKKSKRQSVPKLRSASNNRSIAAVFFVFLSMTIISCDTKPEPFAFGKDGCSFCKMTIITPKFGGEVITKKGKIYKFDDLHCLISFLKSAEVKPGNIAQTLVVDYKDDTKFLDASKSVYVSGQQYHSPMNSNTVAFASAAAISSQEQTANWQTIYNAIQK